MTTRLRPLASLRLVALLATATIVASGCAGATRTTFPPLGSTPAPVGDATAATKQLLIGALVAVGLQAADTISPFRPPEGPLLAAAPRSVLQVTLPDDPTHGFIVVYSLMSPQAAESAASDHAAYVSTGPGRVQFAMDAHFVLRVVGSTVVFFTWSPGSAPDARTKMIEVALATVGEAVQIPS